MAPKNNPVRLWMSNGPRLRGVVGNWQTVSSTADGFLLIWKRQPNDFFFEQFRRLLNVYRYPFSMKYVAQFTQFFVLPSLALKFSKCYQQALFKFFVMVGCYSTAICLILTTDTEFKLSLIFWNSRSADITSALQFMLCMSRASGLTALVVGVCPWSCASIILWHNFSQ